ncbi:unnamed protein product [Paramecium primaurelia]|uniref:Protein kinase domain-containing protein n=1 Tax=Paramecium primaurelia TaxID=5886 RepID=A0A8S1PTK8_PARPR|nr:unnamed protein product [Paramecium primaurelia]
MSSPLPLNKSNDLDQQGIKQISGQINDQFIDTIFNIQRQSVVEEPKKEQKQRVRYTEKLSKIYYLYLKLIMGRQLNDEEDEEFLEYLDHRSTEKGRILKMKNSFEYVDEFDYHMGDVVLSFPNPDSPEVEYVSQMSPMEAITLCMNSFNLKNSGTDFEVIDNLVFLKAIEASIFMLSQVFDDDEAPIEEVVQDSDDDEEKQKSKKKKRTNNLMRAGGENDKISMAAMKIDNKLRAIKQSVKGNKLQAIKEIFNLDYDKLNKSKIKYKMAKGNYFKYDSVKKEWIRTKNDTEDFTTLIRHIVMIQLSKTGFNSRQFLSKDGSIIFVVLYQCDQNLGIVAQTHSITKQLYMQFSDLLSLEPVDKNLRPLRLNNRLWRDQEEYASENLSENFLYLKPKIQELLKEINFKKIARELNLSQLNQQLFSKEGTEDIIEFDGPTDAMWSAYYSYLMYLKQPIRQLREVFRISNEQALTINKTPYHLYKQRFPNDQMLENLKMSEIKKLEEFVSVDQIEQEIELHGRPNEIYRVLKGIFNIVLEQREIQNKYSLIKSYFHLPSYKKITSRQIKASKREMLAMNYLELLQEGLEVTNYQNRQLFTIWDIIGIQPFEPFIPYNITPKNVAFSSQIKLNSIWKKYRVTETGRISLFSTMERMKLNNLALGEKINFSILFSRHLAISAFCLSDDFELFGKTNKALFDPLFEEEYDHEIILKDAQYSYFYRELKHHEALDKRGPNKYILNDYSYVTPKLENLAFIWRFEYKQPWFIPTQQIREYYGEKIALYFTFLGYYTMMLLPIGFIGLIISIIQLLVWNQNDYNYIMPQIIFGMIQIQWANLMYDLWQQREKVFAAQYGQGEGGSGEQAQQRSDFVGNYERSIENDNLNTLNYSDLKKFMRILLTLIIQISILGIYVGIVIGIFFISEELQNSERIKSLIGNEVAQLSVTIPALINLVVILILDPFFDKTAGSLTDYENHKTITEYETNFVFKKYFLSFFAICGPVVEIMFGHERVGLTCINNDCLKHAQYHFSSIFLLQFTLNIWEIMKPKIQVLIRQLSEKREEKVEEQKTKKLASNIDEIRDDDEYGRNEDLNSQKSQSLSPDRASSKKANDQNVSEQQDTQKKETITRDTNPFEKINNFIENEFLYKESYVISPERYGTVDEYMEITLQYSMLVLFGTTFPLCFFIAFIWNVVELQTDKLKLLNDMQRPLPLGESTIGVWNDVLEGLAYLSLVSNSGLISYSRDRIVDYNPTISLLAFFIIILLSNFFLRYIEGSIFGEIPYEIQNLMQRHQYLIKSTIEKFMGSGEKQSSDNQGDDDIKRYPTQKIYGCLLQEQKTNQYEEISSDSDVEDYIVNKQKKKDKQQSQNTNSPKSMKSSPRSALKSETSKKKTKSKLSVSTTMEEEDAKSKKKKESIDSLKKYLATRPSNWAMKFKLKDSNDPEIQQKQKAFFFKTLKFLKMLNELNPHQKLWTDDRFTFRKCFLRRHLVLIRNLDWRRTLIFQENQNKLRHDLKESQHEKYRRQLTILNQNLDIHSNFIEKMEILKKIEEYVEKHLWIDGRKTIVFKVQGVWFSQYRKSTRKQPAIAIAKNYVKLLTNYKSVFKQQGREIDTKPIDERFYSYINSMTQTQIQKYSDEDYLKFVDSIQLLPKTNLQFPLTSKGVSQVEQELDAYIGLDLRKQFNLIHFTYIPFRIQAPQVSILRNQIWNLFIDQQIAKEQPMLYFIVPLDTKKSLHTATLEYNVFAAKQQLYRWLVSQVQKPKLADVMVFFQTEILYHRTLHKDIINRVARFYEKITDIRYMELQLKVPISPLKYLKITLEDPIVNIRDPVIKGYLSRAYGAPKGFSICNGKTFKEVLLSRTNYYSDQEICEFLVSVLDTLSFVECEQGMYHGSINLSTIILLKNQQPNDIWYTYSMIDFGMFYWYDYNDEKVYFTRAIEQNDELWYMSPELITNYLNPKFQIAISPQKCDAYSLGMVGLQMATLGKMGIQIEQLLKDQEGDVERAVKRWIVNSKQQLTMKYPNTMNLVLQLINPDQMQRQFPSQIYQKHKNQQSYKETDVRINFDEALFHQIRQNTNPKITKDQMVRIFDGKNTQLNVNVKDKISIQEYLKQNIYKFEQHLKLHQLDQLEEEIEAFEKNMLQQFFYQLPYAKETGDIISCIDNYCNNQVYEILSSNIHEFKYMVLYLLSKVQMNILKQDYRYAQQLSLKSQEIIKGVEITCVHLLHDITKTEEERQKIQNVHLSIANREQLYELQVSKDQLIKNCKDDKNKLKDVKQLPYKLKQYGHFFQQALIYIYHLQQQYQLAHDISEEYIIDTSGEIVHDVKHSKKNQQGQFIIKEDILIKMVSRLKMYYMKVQISFDSWRDADFQQIHDLLNEINILHSYIKVDEENLGEIDKRKSSLVRQQLQNTQIKIKEDFQRSLDHTLQWLYRQGKFLQIMQLNRSKDNHGILKRLKPYTKNFTLQNCLLNQLNQIPQLGWTGEYFAEINDEKSNLNIFKTVTEIMEEVFFISESFGLKSQIFQNYNKQLLALLIYHCSHLLYYNPITISEGIFQGFMQILKDQTTELLNCILSIKILHILIHTQNHQYPYITKKESNNIQAITPTIMEQSLIKQLHTYYQPLLPFFFEEYNSKKNNNSWLKNNLMNNLITELIQGYFFINSKQNLESFEDEHLETFLKSIEAKHASEESLCNKNGFMVVEHNLARARLCLLSQNHQQLPVILQTINTSMDQIAEEFVLQTDTKPLIQMILLSTIDIITIVQYQLGGNSFSQLCEFKQMPWIKKEKYESYYDIKFVILKILDLNLKNQQLEFASELLKFTLMLFENKSFLFNSTHSSFYQTLQIFNVKIFAYSDEIRLNILKEDKTDERQMEDLFEQVQKAQSFTKRTNNYLEVSKLLLSQSLEQNEMTQIKAALAQIDSASLENQVVLCQLGVKLVIYQMHTGQYSDADTTASNVSQKLFQLIYSQLCKVAIRWQSEKTFQKTTKKDLKIEEMFKILNQTSQIYEKYEHNVLALLEPIKELFLNVRQFKTLKQIIFLRTVFQYLESLHTLAIMMKGDFKLAQANLSFVDKFGQQSQVEEIITLNSNIQMNLDLIIADYMKGIQKSQLMIQTIEDKQQLLNVQIKTNKNERIFCNLEFEKYFEIKKPEQETTKQLVFSYDQTLMKSALRPYFEINRLKTEAFLCYLESSLNVADKLTQVVDPMFAIQKYVQQQYGSNHIFNAHIQRLIAGMYSEFLTTLRVKDLEEQLITDTETKINAFKAELNQKTIKILESKVKNKCSPAMEQKYLETKSFIQSKITVLEGINEGLSIDLVCRWSLIAANQSFAIYRNFCQEYSYEYSPQLAYLYSTYSDIYFIQSKIVSTMKYLEEAKSAYEFCQTSIYNPDYCKLTFRQGYLRQNIMNMIKNYVDVLMGLSLLTPSKKFEILTLILKEDKTYLQHFDNYKTHGFVRFLEQNLLKQLELDTLSGKRLPDLQRKDQKKLIQFLQVEGDKLAFQLTIDQKAKVPTHTIELIIKDGIETLQKEKIKMDYSGEEYFQKAYQICKALLPVDNPLCQKLEFYAVKQKSKAKRRTSTT